MCKYFYYILLSGVLCFPATVRAAQVAEEDAPRPAPLGHRHVTSLEIIAYADQGQRPADMSDDTIFLQFAWPSLSRDLDMNLGDLISPERAGIPMVEILNSISSLVRCLKVLASRQPEPPAIYREMLQRVYTNPLIPQFYYNDAVNTFYSLISSEEADQRRRALEQLYLIFDVYDHLVDIHRFKGFIDYAGRAQALENPLAVQPIEVDLAFCVRFPSGDRWRRAIRSLQLRVRDRFYRRNYEVSQALFSSDPHNQSQRYRAAQAMAEAANNMAVLSVLLGEARAATPEQSTALHYIFLAASGGLTDEEAAAASAAQAAPAAGSSSSAALPALLHHDLAPPPGPPPSPRSLGLIAPSPPPLPPDGPSSTGLVPLVDHHPFPIPSPVTAGPCLGRRRASKRPRSPRSDCDASALSCQPIARAEDREEVRSVGSLAAAPSSATLSGGGAAGTVSRKAPERLTITDIRDYLSSSSDSSKEEASEEDTSGRVTKRHRSQRLDAKRRRYIENRYQELFSRTQNNQGLFVSIEKMVNDPAVIAEQKFPSRQDTVTYGQVQKTIQKYQKKNR